MDNPKEYLAELMSYDGYNLNDADLFENKHVLLAWVDKYIYYLNFANQDKEVIRISKSCNEAPIEFSIKLVGFGLNAKEQEKIERTV